MVTRQYKRKTNNHRYKWNKDSTKTITSNFKNPFKLLQSSKIYQNVNPKESRKSQDSHFKERQVNP